MGTGAIEWDQTFSAATTRTLYNSNYLSIYDRTPKNPQAGGTNKVLSLLEHRLQRPDLALLWSTYTETLTIPQATMKLWTSKSKCNCLALYKAINQVLILLIEAYMRLVLRALC
jgi:hypothetical protein